jgi:Predicted membrane protein
VRRNFSQDGGARRDSHGAVETMVSLVLRIGVLSSSAIICCGIGLILADRIISAGMGIDSAVPYPRSIHALWTGLVAFDPASVIAAGLLMLIATPFARVAVSIVAFALERDWRYVAITALVLAILVTGVVIGKIS